MLAADIVSRIPDAFDKALSDGDLLFFPSTVYKHEESNVEVSEVIFFDQDSYAGYWTCIIFDRFNLHLQ
jgi:hypothetical protein